MKLGLPFTKIYNACAKNCLGGNAADWMTHLEEAGPWEEAVWHHRTNRKRGSPGKNPQEDIKGPSE